MVSSQESIRRMELALWNVKEAAWALYGDSWNHEDVQAFAAFIAHSASEVLKKIGCDPVVLRK